MASKKSISSLKITQTYVSSPQKHPFFAQNPTFPTQNHPKTPKITQKPPFLTQITQNHPKSPQNPQLSPQKNPKTPPKHLKNAKFHLKTPQKHLKTPQKTPFLPQNHLKTPKFALKPPQKCLQKVPETAFNICTFWFISALAKIGRKSEARRMFENILSCRNAVGLLSEDIEVEGEGCEMLWGNFPQT
jgi:hypothetical protein